LAFLLPLPFRAPAPHTGGSLGGRNSEQRALFVFCSGITQHVVDHARIGIERVRLRLSRRPLWILDEPLTALDSDGTDVLRDLLDAHLEAGGICVAASHQPLPIALERQKSLRLEGDGSAQTRSAIQ